MKCHWKGTCTATGREDKEKHLHEISSATVANNTEGGDESVSSDCFASLSNRDESEVGHLSSDDSFGCCSFYGWAPETANGSMCWSCDRRQSWRVSFVITSSFTLFTQNYKLLNKNVPALWQNGFLLHVYPLKKVYCARFLENRDVFFQCLYL